MVPFVKVIAIVALFDPTCSTADCASTGSCKTEADETSLLQVGHSVKHGIERVPVEDDKELDGGVELVEQRQHQGAEVSDRDMLNALVRYANNKTAAQSGLQSGEVSFHGFYGFDFSPNIHKCFLSKKSIFTCPFSADGGRQKMREGCQTYADDLKIERESTESADCQKCLQDMKSKLPDTLMVQGKSPDECQRCGKKWGDLCFPPAPEGFDFKAEADRVFQAQEKFMLELAKKLLVHEVALYLDFVDEDAEQLVFDYDGREVAFNSPDFYQKMLALLQRRVGETDTFIHWMGASGEFCLAEQSGVTRKTKVATFTSPPLGYLQAEGRGGKYSDAICYADGYHAPVLEQICTLCGGTNCHVACGIAQQ